jgi:hypothetical protein
MRAAILLSLVLVSAACAVRPELVADTNAVRAPDNNPTGYSLSGAITTVAGAKITVDGAAWNGDPFWANSSVLPVQVTIENHSGRPLSVSAGQFSLVGKTGVKYRALPLVPLQDPLDKPLPDRGAAMGPVARALFYARGFYVAPNMSGVYPRFAVFPMFTYDVDYYRTSYKGWPGSLPSMDMLSRALPDGVVDDGGIVSGFVYFPMLPSSERHVRFDLQLVDTEHGRRLALAFVPLAVRRPL